MFSVPCQLCLTFAQNTLSRAGGFLTFGDGKVGNGLPPIHRYAPSTLHPAATEINDQLLAIAAERG